MSTPRIEASTSLSLEMITSILAPFIPLLGLLSLHAWLRPLVSPSLNVDESDLILFNQAPAWGYGQQPPFYSWLLWIWSRGFGAGLLSQTCLRLGLLGLVVVAIHRCVREMTGDHQRALLAGYSIFLLLFGWHALTYLTHSLLVALFGVLSCHAMWRLRDNGGPRQYLLIGVLAGCGMLSKYNFVFLVGALFLSGLCDPGLRRRLLHPGILLSALASVLVCAPHAFWMIEHGPELIDAYRDTGAMNAGRSVAGAIPRGTFELLVNSLLLALPLLAAFAWAFGPGSLRVLARSEPVVRWLRWLFVWLIVLCLLYVVAAEAGRFHQRWVEPFVVLLPLLLFAAPRAKPEQRPLRRYVALLVLCAAASVAARIGQIWLGSSLRGFTPQDASFRAVARQLRAEVLRGTVLVAGDRGIAGNLLLLLQLEDFAVSADRPLFVPDSTRGARRYLFVWYADEDRKLPRSLREFADGPLQVPLRRDGPAGDAWIEPLVSRRSARKLHYLIVDTRSGRPPGSPPG